MSSRVVRHVFDPYEVTGVRAPKGGDDGSLEDAADFLKEQILEHVGDERSPVSGHGRFPGLSKDYAAKKKADGHPPRPNLEYDGDLLEALDVYARKDGKIVVETRGREGAKADGHNNHSGESTLPLRRYIPADDETFKKPILDGIRRILVAGGGE